MDRQQVAKPGWLFLFLHVLMAAFPKGPPWGGVTRAVPSLGIGGSLEVDAELDDLEIGGAEEAAEEDYEAYEVLFAYKFILF